MAEPGTLRILVTRPGQDGEHLATELSGLGFHPHVAPVFRIEFARVEIEDEVGLAQTIVFTSRNGVRAFCLNSQERDKSVYAVGDSTANLAREEGFREVHSASGTGEELARLIGDELSPESGPLLLATGETPAGHFAEILTERGFELLRRTLYKAVRVNELGTETRALLEEGKLDCVLLYSPATAGAFVELVSDHDLAHVLKNLQAVCLSEPVAARLDPAAWKQIQIADRPNQKSLIRKLHELTPGPEPDVAKTVLPETTAARPAFGPASKATAKRSKSWLPALLVSAAVAVVAVFTVYLLLSTWRAELRQETRQSLTELRSDLDNIRKNAFETQENTYQQQIDELRTLVSGTKPSDGDEVSDRIQQIERDLTGLTEKLQAVSRGDGIRPDEFQPGELQRILTRLQSLETNFAELVSTGEQRGGADTGSRHLLDARLQELERKLDQVSEGPLADRPDVTALQNRLAQLERSHDELRNSTVITESKLNESENANPGLLRELLVRTDRLTADFAALENRLASTGAGNPEQTGYPEPAVLLRLKKALETSEPFTTELGELEASANGNRFVAAILADISTLAERGVASRPELLERLPVVIDKAEGALNRKPSDNGWVEQVIESLGGIVKISREEEQTTALALAEARRAGQRADLAEAVRQLSGLGERTASLVSAWLAEAESRLKLERAVARLELGSPS